MPKKLGIYIYINHRHLEMVWDLYIAVKFHLPKMVELRESTKFESLHFYLFI